VRGSVSSADDMTSDCPCFCYFSLFTNPSVSFAYERGWRQGFASAGFPGADKEAELAMEYFAPAVARAEGSNVLIDMSCATGRSAVMRIRMKPIIYST
jgi:hypothetical protein